MEQLEHVVDCGATDLTCARWDVPLSPAQLEMRAALEAGQRALNETTRRKEDALARLQEAALADPHLADLLTLLTS